MKPEEIFGVNAGKVWQLLDKNRNNPLTMQEIMKMGKLTRDDVMSGLGWLGREGKIEVLEKNGKYAYKLL
ncbi:MAG: winged helix-turn-helix domain-containing protein [Candidatus Aenigmatarchaeota archaeon]|nr:winged helix-turn-helix domain-containing protein [Candidatus Aenigmarchaeota archaeon]